MSDGPLREELVTHGIPVHVTAGLPDASAESYECRVQELTAILTLLGPDAVLCNTIDTFFIASAAQRLGIPVVWAVHEHFPLDVWWPYRTDHTKGGFAFESLLGALRSADKLVFEAEATRVLYREMLETDNGATIYYGVDTEPIEQYKTRHSRMAVRRELGVDDDCVLTLSVGIFEPRKAQAAIVEVFSRMVSRYGSLGLLLVGAGKTPYTENLRSFVDALGFDKGQVLIRPVARDIWRYYLAADLLVSAADIESMPRTFLEAMAFDLPIVTTDVGGCKELVLDGVTGWTTKPKTSVGLEIAWERALSNRSQWADFARVGRLLLERRHDSARHSSSVAQILRSAVGIRAR
jgi:glycosyltransferase involved in cell wall biosynthesis